MAGLRGGYDERGEPGVGKTHAGAYGADPRFSLQACIEPNGARRDSFMSRWGINRGYETLDKCFANESTFDLVSICTPSEFHIDALEKLLPTRPRCVFCEKPITGNPRETLGIIKAYEAAGIPIAVNYIRRWDPRMVALRDELTSGAWGRLQAISGIYAKGLFNSGSHFLDLIHFLFGPLKPLRVVNRVDDGRSEDPTLSVLLKTEAGVPVNLIGTNYQFFYPFEIDLILQSGRISIEDLGGRLRLRKIRSHPKYPHQQALDYGVWEDTEMDRAFAEALDNIFSHLLEGTPLVSNGRSALLVERLCAEIMNIENEGEMR